MIIMCLVGNKPHRYKITCIPYFELLNYYELRKGKHFPNTKFQETFFWLLLVITSLINMFRIINARTFQHRLAGYNESLAQVTA